MGLKGINLEYPTHPTVLGLGLGIRVRICSDSLNQTTGACIFFFFFFLFFKGAFFTGKFLNQKYVMFWCKNNTFSMKIASV